MSAVKHWSFFLAGKWLVYSTSPICVGDVAICIETKCMIIVNEIVSEGMMLIDGMGNRYHTNQDPFQFYKVVSYGDSSLPNGVYENIKYKSKS